LNAAAITPDIEWMRPIVYVSAGPAAGVVVCVAAEVVV